MRDYYAQRQNRISPLVLRQQMSHRRLSPSLWKLGCIHHVMCIEFVDSMRATELLHERDRNAQKRSCAYVSLPDRHR